MTNSLLNSQPKFSENYWNDFCKTVYTVRANNTIWQIGLKSEFDRFVNKYLEAIVQFIRLKTGKDYSDLLKGVLNQQPLDLFNPIEPLPGVLNHYVNVIAPNLASAKNRLDAKSLQAYETIHNIAEMLLDVINTSSPDSEEFENWLYEIGQQFVQELEAEGLLSNVQHEEYTKAFPLSDALAA